MDKSTLEVTWQQMRPGVTVLRSDGGEGQATVVDRSAGTIVVLYSDGRREHHFPDERARVVVRGT
jgi:hypothetical protein